jgi:hypothetical protein
MSDDLVDALVKNHKLYCRSWMRFGVTDTGTIVLDTDWALRGEPAGAGYTNWYGQFSIQRLKLEKIRGAGWINCVCPLLLEALCVAFQEMKRAQEYAELTKKKAEIPPGETMRPIGTYWIAEKASADLLRKGILYEKQEWTMVKHLHELDSRR